MPPNEPDSAPNIRKTALSSSKSFNAHKRPSTTVDRRWVYQREQGCHSATTASKIMSQPTIATTRDVHPAQPGENVGGLSRRNPLPALAVHIDVSISAVLLMLGTALRAAFQELAAAFRGDHRRFSMAEKLHRQLERLWLLPSQRLLGDIRKSQLDDSLLQLHHVSKRLKSALSYTRVFPTEKDEFDMYLAHGDTKRDVRHMEGSQCLQTQSICRLPMVRDDEDLVSPPMKLLAAYAESSSKDSPDAAQSCLTAMTTANPLAECAHSLSHKPSCVVGLCVRSLLDLFIQAIRSLHPALLPEGSVVLMAAVNIPMMFQILEEHKLLVQPVDLDPSTLMPTNESLHQVVALWGPRVKAFVCSHLYGGISDMEPLAAFCTKYKILLIEDCAESFVGELYRGSSRADVSLFSFGLIKTCTAAGGGIATVRSRTVAARMQSIQALYPFSSRRTSLKKLCITLGACFLQSPFIMKSLLMLCKKRLETWDLSEFVAQQSRTFTLSRRLQSLGVQIPGGAASFKTFWLFPVLPPPNCNAAEFALALRNNGLYAARDASTLVCWSASPSAAVKMTRPVLAADMMSRIVYLPINRRFTQHELLQAEAAVAKTVAMFDFDGNSLGTFGSLKSAS
ncbi:hypothetical protein Emag_000587 [Eimeria magna]